MSNSAEKLDEWEAAKARRDQYKAAEPELPLKGGSGGGTMRPMEPSMKDYVDARDDAIESRLSAKLDKLPTADAMRNNIWGAAVAIMGVILAAIAFGGDRFDAGIGMADQRQEQIARDAQQDQAVKRMEGKIDKLIAASQK